MGGEVCGGGERGIDSALFLSLVIVAAVRLRGRAGGRQFRYEIMNSSARLRFLRGSSWILPYSFSGYLRSSFEQLPFRKREARFAGKGRGRFPPMDNCDGISHLRTFGDERQRRVRSTIDTAGRPVCVLHT